MEMSGAGSASLHRVLAEAETDLMLRLEVRVIVNRTLENSDAHTSKYTESKKFLIDGWSRIDRSELDQIVGTGDNIGLLRFRRNHRNLSPSYQDRRIMKSLRTRNETSVFILVNGEATDCLGIKHKMTAFLISRDAAHIRANVRIKVPCLGAKSQYIPGQPSTGVRGILMQGVSEESVIGCNGVIQSFDKVRENFHKNVDAIVNEVLELENEREELKKKILKVKNRIQAKETLLRKTKVYDFDTISQQFLDQFLGDSEADVNLNTIYRADSGESTDVEGASGNSG